VSADYSHEEQVKFDQSLIEKSDVVVTRSEKPLNRR